jgi:hypothetical protein
MLYDAWPEVDLALRRVEVERDHERLAQTTQRLRIEDASAPADRRLWDGEEVVAVDDAVSGEAVLAPERNLRRKLAYGSGHGRHSDVCKHRDRSIAGEDHDQAAPTRKFDVIDLAAIQRGVPPSALSNAARPANPVSPTHSSCGWFP